MELMKCGHPGCKNKHKSPSGYCADHVAQHGMSRRTHVPHNERACSNPHLAEEDVRGFFMPRVI